MMLYPRPNTGVTSKLRILSSEIVYTLPLVTIGNEQDMIRANNMADDDAIRIGIGIDFMNDMMI